MRSERILLGGIVRQESTGAVCQVNCLTVHAREYSEPLCGLKRCPSQTAKYREQLGRSSTSPGIGRRPREGQSRSPCCLSCSAKGVRLAHWCGHARPTALTLNSRAPFYGFEPDHSQPRLLAPTTLQSCAVAMCSKPS